MRGFDEQAPALGDPLQVRATPQVVKDQNGSGNLLTFAFSIANPTGETARNVRIFLESLDGKFTPTAYMQGFGDLAPGATIQVGTSNGLDLGLSVYGSPNASGAAKFRLRVKVENGPETIVEGQANL
jgi:hypothetical protein